MHKITGEFKIPLRIIGIDMLATFLFTKGQFYAHHYLNIPISTGQILSKIEFLKQYGKRNLATPLDNEFVGREKDRSALLEKIEGNNIVIVSGPAGVGKSKLCLQVRPIFL